MPSCTGRSKLKSESTSSQAMAPSHSSSSHHSHSGRYQPRPSKVRMKLSRYSVRGASQSSGTDATFCVRWLVTASSSTEPVAASDSQRRYGGFVAALSSRSVSTAEGGVSQASAAQEAAKPVNSQDQKTTCSCAARYGSTTNG